MLLQRFYGILQCRAGYKLRRIGRYGTARKDIQILTDIRMLYHIEQIRMLRVTQVIRNACHTLAKVEHLVQTRLADVQTHNNHFLTHKGKTHCDVPRNERLTLTRHRGGEHDHTLIRLQHEKKVRTHSTEHLLHHVVAVLLYHNGATFRFLLQWDLTYNRHFRDLLHILTVLYPVLEQIPHIDDTYRDGDSQNQCRQINNAFLRGDGIDVRQGLLDNAPVIGCGCQRDGVLLTFL